MQNVANRTVAKSLPENHLNVWNTFTQKRIAIITNFYNLFFHFIVFFLLIILNCLILFAYWRWCLQRFNNTAVCYVLGMMLAYNLLILIAILFHKYAAIVNFLQQPRPPKYSTDIAIFYIIIPTVYSVLLLGYYEKSRQHAPWKFKRRIITSVTCNALKTIFTLIFLDFIMKGGTTALFFATLKDAFHYTDWYVFWLMIACFALFFTFLKIEHYWHNKK